MSSKTMQDIELLTGWAKHNSFGLRKEWVQLCLSNPDNWQHLSALGNRQVEAMEVWLKTTGLIERQRRKTFLWKLFNNEGIGSLKAWEILWVNVVFNFPTARWFVYLLKKENWSTHEIKKALRIAMPRLKERTASNAVLELVGFLERTPVGDELGQGKVLPTRPRRVQREGYPTPSWEAVSHVLFRLFQEEQRYVLHLHEDLLWPWIIFCCRQEHIIQSILLHNEGNFSLDEHCIKLAKNNC